MKSIYVSVFSIVGTHSQNDTLAETDKVTKDDKERELPREVSIRST